MNENTNAEFLRKRMIELREKNGKNQSDMAELLFVNKSTLSRVEKGDCSYKNIREFAERYWEAIYDPERILSTTFRSEETEKKREQERLRRQKELFLRGDKVVVTDTSALLKNNQLIDELSKEYSHVIVPMIVITELDNIKNNSENESLAARAWQILSSIGSNVNVEKRECSDNNNYDNNDAKIISVARAASVEYNCIVDIITYDAGFAARLSGDSFVRSLFLEEYMLTKQSLVDIRALNLINSYYADSYDNIEEALGIKIPNRDDITAYLPDGNTLLISIVRNKRAPMNQRKAKIKWLMSINEDIINKRDCGRYYFPPLSHAVQNGDIEIFKFLLHDCQANPNVGSRNPYDAGKIHQKNDGNMPLMIAAWDDKKEFVEELCADERTSLNQQDGNGFTALIKACYWRNIDSRNILIKAGADTKIVDRDGYTAQDRLDECLKTGRSKKNKKPKSGGGWR